MLHPLGPPLHSPWRWPVVVFLLTNAAIHLDLAPMHLMEAPYIGALFIALSAACIILAAALAFVDSPLVWVGAGATSVLALIAFLVSRTVGLPQIADDIGNWTEPWGNPTIAVEALTIVCTLVVLRSRRPRAMSREAPPSAVQVTTR